MWRQPIMFTQCEGWKNLRLPRRCIRLPESFIVNKKYNLLHVRLLHEFIDTNRLIGATTIYKLNCTCYRYIVN